MYYVYILKSSKDNKIYTGFTSNLRLRITQHNNGLVTSTKNRRPLILIYYEAYLDKKDARIQEEYLKAGGNAKTTLKNKLKYSLERI